MDQKNLLKLTKETQVERKNRVTSGVKFRPSIVQSKRRKIEEQRRKEEVNGARED